MPRLKVPFWKLCDFHTRDIFALLLSPFPQWLADNYLKHKVITHLSLETERKGEAGSCKLLVGQVWGNRRG
jgi:hypothetical protein